MKVSKSWLKELVDLNISDGELANLFPLRTIGIKDDTADFIELDMKGYNRADLLSIRGVANEVAAITNSKVKFEETEDSNYSWIQNSYPELKVEVLVGDKCPLYCAVLIEDLKVEASPSEWVAKLASSGMRSINNVADVTNLVMLEYGQPTHAFDASKVADKTLSVRFAKNNEKLLTLDNKERELLESDLVMADSEKALGLAGVMGGKDSEVTENTTSILLEAAIFDSKSIRKTASRLNLPSEASKRFQHGLTKKRLLQAMDQAIKLYQELGGKVTGIVIKGQTDDSTIKVLLTKEKIDNLIGVEITSGQVEEYLTRLNFEVKKIDDRSWEVIPPYYRLDILQPEDVIEEIARIYGYEKIPSKELAGDLPEKINQTLFETIYSTKEKLVKAGLTEVQTYSFLSTDLQKALSYTKENMDQELIQVENPMSLETEYLKAYLWPNLVEVVGKNLRNGISDIAIFEIAKVYMLQIGEMPKESYHIGLALMNGTDNPIAELTSLVKAANLSLEIKEEPIMEELKSLFHPKRYLAVYREGKMVGAITEVHPRILDKLGITKRVAILEISLKTLV